MPKPIARVDERLRFVEFCLRWDREVGRPRLMNQFGISAQQASHDLKSYKLKNPGAIKYSLENKRYHPSSSFTPIFKNVGPKEYLTQLEKVSLKLVSSEESWISYLPEVAIIQAVERKLDANILHSLMKAMENKKAIEIEYTSKTASNKSFRKVVPLAFANDQSRWHVRACDIEKERFSDFVISRISQTGKTFDTQVSTSDDVEWNTMVTILIIPSPKLEREQQEAISFEYGMKNGVLELTVRQALIFYILRQLGFNPIPSKKNKFRNVSSFELKIKNVDEVENWLNYRP